VLGLAFPTGISRVDRDNAIDQYLREDLTSAEETVWRSCFDEVPRRLSGAEKRQWLDQLRGVTLASDAYIPFRDNVDRAYQTGVEYIVQPGGAQRDAEIIAACDEYGMAMALTHLRLFHH
jgi:phosphoribosylaminoimidazolecarboxamide formyltransferase/IMP cyclohydrolase